MAIKPEEKQTLSNSNPYICCENGDIFNNFFSKLRTFDKRIKKIEIEKNLQHSIFILFLLTELNGVFSRLENINYFFQSIYSNDKFYDLKLFEISSFYNSKFSKNLSKIFLVLLNLFFFLFFKKEPLSLISQSKSTILKFMSSNMPFLFDFKSKQLFFRNQSFNIKRSIFTLLQVKKNKKQKIIKYLTKEQ